MNLNQNFQLVKTDFSDPLKLILDYLKTAKGLTVGMMGSSLGIDLVYNLT